MPRLRGPDAGGMSTSALDRALQTFHGLARVRALVSLLLLVGLGACGAFAATFVVIVAVVVDGIGGGLDGLVRDLLLTVAGALALSVVPVVVALWLRPRRPVASGVVASLAGATLLAVCGPQAHGLDTAAVLAWAGLLLVVCALPLPEGARFGG